MAIHRIDEVTISTDSCWELLRTAVIGRLAVILGDRPDIFPINYVVDRGTVVFRTALGTKLDAALGQQRVVFESDGYDKDAELAWSVVVHGKAEMVESFDEVVDASSLPLFPWHPGAKGIFVRIVAGDITGRAFPITDPEVWGVWPTSPASRRQGE